MSAKELKDAEVLFAQAAEVAATLAFSDGSTLLREVQVGRYNQLLCVCVCVCVREREREREKLRNQRRKESKHSELVEGVKGDDFVVDLITA